MAAGEAHERVWWQGAPFTIKGRGEHTAGALGVIEASFWPGFATPHHVHHREHEGWFILEGAMRFRLGDEEFVAGAGEFVFGPRDVAHSFKSLDRGARALMLMSPAGLEHMFVEGGAPIVDPAQPPPREFDIERVRALLAKYGCEAVGPPLP